MILVLIQSLQQNVLNVEVRTQFVSTFDQNSLFPHITLDEILEVEFNLSLHLHLPYFDNMDYYQFIWIFERLKKHIKENNEKSQ